MGRTHGFCIGIGMLLGCHGSVSDRQQAATATFGLDSRPSNPTCVAPPRPTTAVTTVSAFGALRFNQPVLVLQAPGDASRWFVVEKGGTVKVFSAGASSGSVFIDIAARVSASSQEAGLLGMAFHPGFASNGQVFLSYTGFGGPTNLHSNISRFTSSDGGLTLDPDSEEKLLGIDQPYTNHNGGNIAFGPDGYLYAGFGDGGSAGDPHGNGQNTNVLLAKMLRLDVDGAAPYAIPPSNPFAHGGGRGEIFAWGLRNPWRWSFDRQTGELWAGDVGQDAYEEIDKVVLGGNYGWNVREGLHCYNRSSCSNSGFTDPVAEYDHSHGIAVTGGYVYRGSDMPLLAGTYIYGDYGNGTVWGLFFDPITGKAAPQVLASTGLSISSFGEGADGELYLISFATGEIRKLVTATSSSSHFPATLSATGCVDPSDATRPGAGLIPYDVNAPLWSDGAGKQRWLALPDGKQIHVNSDGDWDLPIGSVLMKQFTLAGKRVETRLFIRHSDGGWAGYSYAWNAAGTDATLLDGGKTTTVGAQTWTFPSRQECLRCHTAAAGGSLGLETAQLNRDLDYPNGRTANQLATLAHIGLFDAALPATPPQLHGLADASVSVGDRARAYLHGNCSFCHRPGGGGQGPADFRFATAASAMNVCNVTPTEGDLGVAGAKLLTPGDPAHSIISLRTHATGKDRMPPLATAVVDSAATATLDAWITSITSCP